VPARWLDGAAVARAIRAEIAREVADLKASTGRAPRLAAVLVGDDPASQVYVRNKVAACAEVGIRSDTVRLEATTAQDRLVGRIQQLNDDPDIDAILVQLPLPRGLDRMAVLLGLDPGKDVDGLHPLNAGRLLMKLDAPVPCTPAGIIDLLERNRLPVAGRHAVVVGRSEIVGRPMTILLMQRDATVTVCHSKTPDLASFTARADLLIAAIGRPAFLRLDDPGAAASIFGADSPRVRQVRERGYTLVGDVHPVEAAERAAFLTPVPGGVGPLTIACLLRNTLRAARLRRRPVLR
jgi:methylenetetrahydrofolate dehydrogenase (NADP+)/methenyltetrahydrofolate cyclohydrolase